MKMMAKPEKVLLGPLFKARINFLRIQKSNAVQ